MNTFNCAGLLAFIVVLVLVILIDLVWEQK